MTQQEYETICKLLDDSKQMIWGNNNHIHLAIPLPKLEMIKHKLKEMIDK